VLLAADRRDPVRIAALRIDLPEWLEDDRAGRSCVGWIRPIPPTIGAMTAPLTCSKDPIYPG
jgi:hypothetical protein